MSEPTALKFPETEAGEGGTVSAWLVAEGEPVQAGQSVVEVEIDKTSVELPAPHDGRVVEITKAVGAELQTGDVLAWIEPAKRSGGLALQSLQLRIHCPCPSCGTPVAINGPWQHATCGRCGERAAMSEAFWEDVFARVNRGEQHCSVDVGPWRFFVRGAKASPGCHNCETALPVDADTPMRSVRCSRCSLEHVVLSPPDWLGRRDATIRRVVGVLEPVEPAAPKSCPHCGTPVHPHSRAIAPRCSGCGRDVVGPNPPTVPRSWAVLRATR